MSISPRKALDKYRFLEFVKRKIDLAEQIYGLLADLSTNSKEIQEEIFSLIPNFQIQAKYLPAACKCLSALIGNNANLQGKISKNVRFAFDFQEAPTQKFNILINIIDSEKGTDRNPGFFLKQDKLITKPINLMNFFMNLLWDKEKGIKPDYLRFMRSLCRFQGKGVNINQEMMFKLYNCMVLSKDDNPLLIARV